MDKRFWAIILVIVVIFGGVLFFKNMHKANAPTVQPTNHIEGKDAKSVTLVEYGDYECPACEEYYPIVKQVVQKYNNDITFQFRNLPLSTIHPNAFAGARAAEAAALQNKFWEMHDALYDNQNSWAQSSNPQQFFNQYAQQLGLNLSQFQKDYSSSRVNDTINADVAAFEKTKADMATPAFFLDGKQIKPDPTVDSFSKLLDAEIVKKNPAPTSTTNTSASAQD
jgi:protein-disulfide isomerase